MNVGAIILDSSTLNNWKKPMKTIVKRTSPIYTAFNANDSTPIIYVFNIESVVDGLMGESVFCIVFDDDIKKYTITTKADMVKRGWSYTDDKPIKDPDLVIKKFNATVTDIQVL